SLAAGEVVELVLGAGGRITARVDAEAFGAEVRNEAGGAISADGGVVLLSAKAKDALLDTVVNNEGTIEARTLANVGGVIKLLGGASGGSVHVGGALDVSAPDGGDGGSIETSGYRVEVAEGAEVTAAAPAGEAGEWRIGSGNFVIADAGPGGN